MTQRTCQEFLEKHLSLLREIKQLVTSATRSNDSHRIMTGCFFPSLFFCLVSFAFRRAYRETRDDPRMNLLRGGQSSNAVVAFTSANFVITVPSCLHKFPSRASANPQSPPSPPRGIILQSFFFSMQEKSNGANCGDSGDVSNSLEFYS